jgi:ferredoxin
VACQRAARSSAKPYDVVAHCLGAFAPSTWLELIRHAGARGLQLIDPGVCATCPAGKTAEPWAEALKHTAAVLKASGLPLSLLPALRAAAETACEDAPHPNRRHRRRNALAPLATRIVVESSSRKAPGTKLHATAVKRELEQLRALTRRRGARNGAAAMPRAAASPSCTVCGACTAVCPTPALATTREETQSTLTFDASECLLCGRCAAACPQRALRLEASGGALEPIVVRAVRR